MSKYIFILCMFVQFIYAQLVPNNVFENNRQDQENNQIDLRNAVPSDFKYNVILFLADPTGIEQCESQKNKRSVYRNAHDSLKKLQLEQKSRIKHCTSALESKIGDSFSGALRFGRNSCNCEELLKTSLLALIKFCSDELGMTTALTSVSENSITRDIRFHQCKIPPEEKPKVKLEPQKEETQNKQLLNTHVDANSDEKVIINSIKEDNKSQKLSPLMEKMNKTCIPAPEKLDFEQEYMPQMRRVNMDNMLPIFEIFNPRRRMRFNNINPWMSRRMKRQQKIDIVTKPEQTDVFKIRNKRYDNLNEETSSESEDIPGFNRKASSFWDMFNIMNNIRYSFLNNLFTDRDDPTRYGREDTIDDNLLGEIHEVSLFDIVKSTLNKISNESSTGFLMIVIGGKLTDIHSGNSPLIQSVQYVTDNTDSANTLVVLTGHCPPNDESKTMETRTGMIPVYAKGCGSEVFQGAHELYDIPMQIKKYLQMKIAANTPLNDGGPSFDDGNAKFRGKRSNKKCQAKKNCKCLLNQIDSKCGHHPKCCHNDSDNISKAIQYLILALLFIFCF